MKKLLGATLIVALVSFALVVSGCGPARDDGGGNKPAGDTSIGKAAICYIDEISWTGGTAINFEGEDPGNYIYDVSSGSNTQFTLPDWEVWVAEHPDAVETSAVIDGNAGAKTLKLAGTFLPDYYGDDNYKDDQTTPSALEYGIRFKIAEYLGTNSVDFLNKTLSIKVRVPNDEEVGDSTYTQSAVTAVQVILQSKNDQQAMGGALSVTSPPEDGWITLHYKLVKKDDPDFTSGKSWPFEFIAVDEAGAKLAESGGGAYSSDTFDASDVTELEIRVLGGKINDE